jgi:hypothetical protein
MYVLLTGRRRPLQSDNAVKFPIDSIVQDPIKQNINYFSFDKNSIMERFHKMMFYL